jgi:hypothetical protein
LSSGDEDIQFGRPDVPFDRKGSATNDAEGKGTPSVETLILGPIKTDVPGEPKPSVVDRTSVKPPAGGRGRKCICAAIKWPNPVPQADQVITQIELPPYYGPRSPLDLVAVEIICGRIFEAFHRMSHATSAGGDKPPRKKAHRVLLKKNLAPRYSNTFLFHIVSC